MQKPSVETSATKANVKPRTATKKTGTQSIERVLQLLRLATQYESEGLLLQDILEETGLERSTAYRFMSCLVQERFLRRDPVSKRYFLGIDAMQLGLAAMQSSPVAGLLKPLIQRLARLSGDTVFLVIQQGDYCLCLHREHSDFPVRIFTVSVGEKRLLGLGAGGLALLARKDDSTIAQAYTQHAKQYQAADLTLDALLTDVRLTRETGYSQIVDRITTGVSGVGYAFPLSTLTMAAISFGAINSRLDVTRRREMGQILATECQKWVTQNLELV